MFAGFVMPGMLDSDLMPPYDELVKLLLCKYELCKFAADCDDEISGEVYKCDETDDEWPCDDEDGVAVDADDDCKSYLAGELTVDECMLEMEGDVRGYEAW